MTATFAATETGVAVSRGRELWERLLRRGHEFDFFQAVWLLERYLSRDEHVAVGQRGPVAKEALRFRPDTWMGFPSTDVRRVLARGDPESGQTLYQIDVTFLGLYGVSTPLPPHYAVDILRSVVAAPAPQTDAPRVARPEDDLPLGAGYSPSRDFLDVFHHRLVSLFYRSWTKYHYDKAFGLSQRDEMTTYLLWLIGCPRGYDEAVLGVPPLRLLRYAGVLTQHPRSAVTLEGLLKDYWGVEFRAEQFVGRWVALSAADFNRIGQANSRLGLDLTVGEQVYDLTGAFNIVMGPVDWNTYTAFLPDGANFAQLQALTRLYCIDPLRFTLEIKLKAGEVPETRLGSDPNAGRLGFTSWVRTVDVPETSVMFDASATPRRPSAKPASPPAAKAASPSPQSKERPEPLYANADADARRGDYAR